MREAEWLYGVFFSAPAPERIAVRYIEAHERFELRDQELTRRVMDLSLAGLVNAEAVELALRLADRRNSFTRKVEIIHFLAECLPENFSSFSESRDRPLWAWIGLAGAGLRSVLFRLRGGRAVRRYGLA